MSSPETPRPSRRTIAWIEVFVAVLTILPFIVLAYSYQMLPDRVPLLVTLKGEVAVWAEKSCLSVFRVPLMAVVIQVVCLLMKFSVLQTEAALPTREINGYSQLHELFKIASARLWDCLRCIAALKMSASS